jgi:hypothetical protein
MKNTTASAQALRLLPTWLTSLIVAVGPIASVLFLLHAAGSSWLPGDALAPVVAGTLFMWSPQPLSIPALLTQDARDQALTWYQGVWGSAIRAVRLVPYLLTRASGVRVETAASLVGFAAGVMLAVARLG